LTFIKELVFLPELSFLYFESKIRTFVETLLSPHGSSPEQLFMDSLKICPQSLSPKFTNLRAKCPVRFPIGKKCETIPSLVLVPTEKVGGTLPLKFANLGLKD
jgi:hypothetical protein